MKQDQHTLTYKTISFMAALVIALAITAPAMAGDSLKAAELYWKGLDAATAQKYEEAIKYFEAVLKIDPDHAEVHYNLGLTYANLDRYTDAVEAFKQIIRIDPDHAAAHLNLGMAYYELRRHAKEIKAYKQALRINSYYVEAHINLGLAYGNLERWAEAIEALIQAIRIKYDSARAHYWLGAVYVYNGDIAAAFGEYKILYELDPEMANELVNLMYKMYK